ncbi:MAG: hypothetical protein AB8G05_26030 [Oligoflexales bacterium]
MASKMMLGILTVLCFINMILLFSQTTELNEKYMKLQALIEINQNSIKNQENNLEQIRLILDKIRKSDSNLRF